MSLVSISLVTYNGEKWLKRCLASVKKQSYTNWQVLIIDNASQDKTVALAKEAMSDAGLILNQENLGFAAGHNCGISQSKGDYILCLNQDVILHPNFLQEAVATLELDDKIGAVQGKLLSNKQQATNDKGQATRNREQGLKKENVSIIDTTGLVIFKNRRVVNRGQGEADCGQYEKCQEVFGADGAAPLYRRAALDEVVVAMTNKEYFDEDFFAYKEDIDLSWRLRLAGWKIVYQPKAIAWHARGAGSQATMADSAIVKQHQKMNRFCRQLSWKNQRLMQIKNELPSLFWRHLPAIAWKELKSTGYILLVEPWLLKAVWQFFKDSPGAWQKRRTVMAAKSITKGEMEKWFA